MRAVTLYATSACNLRCKHCGVGPDQLHVRPALSTEALCGIVTRLAAAGTKFVTLLGGEVTLYRQDLGAILEHAASVGMGVSLNTNLTDWQSVAPLLDRPGLAGLIVSLDGATSASHDAMRGRGTFARTRANAALAAAHPRVRSGALTVEIAFVLSALNYREAAGMVGLAREIGTTRLSVKPVKMIGRAQQFTAQLRMSHRDLLDAYCEIVVAWLMAGDLELDMFLAPAVALYLNERFGTSFPVDDHPACGGVKEYGYVDLYGNHVPCPAMSYEENQSTGLQGPLPTLNLLKHDVETVHRAELFEQFEVTRQSRSALDHMHPCRECSFKTTCSPCTADFILGQEMVQVDVCAAVFAHGDEDVPGLTSRLQVRPASPPAYMQPWKSPAKEPRGFDDKRTVVQLRKS